MRRPDLKALLENQRQKYRGPLIMGVINVTPDSFSGDALSDNPGAAFDKARRFLDEGADLLDIGAESTRPGFQPIPLSEERERLLPVLDRIARLPIVLSLDTRKPEMAEESLSYGIQLLNDVGGLSDPGFPKLMKTHSDLIAVLMHSPDPPGTLHGHPLGRDAVKPVREFFTRRIDELRTDGVAPDRLLLDPGLGFGKDTVGNMTLLRTIPEWSGGRPVLLGPSRKRFLGDIAMEPVPDRRDPATLAVQIWGHTQSVSMFRTHNVSFAVQGRRVFEALRSGEGA